MNGGRRFLFVLLAALVLPALPVGPAAAHPIVGFTWYNDGSFAKAGPSGTVITAYATGAQANTLFQLVVGTSQEGNPDHVCIFNRTNVNPNIRLSSSSGFIGNTSGPVVMPIGAWQVCFMSLTTVTAPVAFTMV